MAPPVFRNSGIPEKPTGAATGTSTHPTASPPLWRDARELANGGGQKISCRGFHLWVQSKRQAACGLSNRMMNSGHPSEAERGNPRTPGRKKKETTDFTDGTDNGGAERPSFRIRVIRNIRGLAVSFLYL
jgi:hypothetical protein